MGRKSNKFGKQNYAKLKENCLKSNSLFEDPTFPASDESLNFQRGELPGRVEWKRPTAICPDPKLVVGRLNSSNITQGSLGNCWFVAACCSLAKEKELWDRVVPDFENQDYQPNDANQHGGIFYFRLWVFGKWMDVTIDDRLPTVNGHLIFAHSQQNNEFWCSLLEKAYAKLFGSYAAMEGGNLVDALIDFTAGFAERIELKDTGAQEDEVKRKDLFRTLRKESENHSLMCCAIKALTPSEMNSRTGMGLVMGHAYCITDVRKINTAKTSLFDIFKGREKLRMIRLRNPWGEREWSGAFSDGSEEWSKVSAKDRQKVGLTFQDDGEFWMTFEDFCIHFTDISLCYLINTSWFSFAKKWNEALLLGHWCDGPKGTSTDRAGGCSNHTDTFLQNPQYSIDVKSDDDKFLIMLQQKDVRGEKSANNGLFSIGLQILKVELNRKFRLHTLQKVVSTSDYIETRNVFHKCQLSQGRYVLIPATFIPKQERGFALRVFSENYCNLRELKLDVPKPSILSCIPSYSTAAVIKIREGRNLAESLSSEACSSYLMLFCEKHKVRSPTIKSNSNPHWDFGAVFYRKSTKSNLRIQIWNNRLLKDILIAEVQIDISNIGDKLAEVVNLTPPKTKKAVDSVGQLVFEWFTTSDLNSV